MNEQETTLKQCSSWTKFFQLWIVLYILLYIVTSQFGVQFAFVEKATIWFGKVFLHIAPLFKVRSTGSGDTLFDYVLTLEILFFPIFSPSSFFWPIGCVLLTGSYTSLRS